MIRLPRPALLFCAFVASALALSAQQPPNIISPEIHPDHRVTLRLYAPGASAVTVQGLAKQPQPMTKDSQGVWSLTVGPLTPEIYSYTFGLDGATVTDPLNRAIKKWIRSESMFEIPGSLASVESVPHGVIHRHTFFSKTRQLPNAIQVYTPPGFDPRAATKYPVVYLLHGFGDDETAWAENGRANFIADNLFAQKRAVPAIIVMTNGHPVPIPTGPRPTDYSANNLAAMEQELINEVMPLVESAYPVKQDAAGRAIVGLSMGGGHSLNIGLKHGDLFGWIGGFSSSAPTANLDHTFRALVDASAKKSGEPRLLWIAIGEDDFLLEQNKTFVGWLTEKNIRHTWLLTPGGHEWPVWRRYLGEFLPLLFK